MKFVKFRALTLLAIAAAAIAAACRNNTGPVARIRTSTDTLVAYALTGTSPALPAALDLTGIRSDTSDELFAAVQLERVDSIFEIDLVFDIDSASGQAVLITPRRVANRLASRFVVTGGGATPVGPQQVGLQLFGPGTTFEQVQESPSGGFTYDSLARVENGRVVAIQSFVSDCVTSFQQYVYAKLVVDSAKWSEKKVYFRIALNGNCGFRSFREGLPRE